VSIMRKLRAVFLGVALIFGSLAGMPMRPEDIEELMHSMNQTRVVQVITDQKDKSGEPPH
jgi:hypothetical protein